MTKAGDVVLVRFPFATLDSSKKRPALLLRHLRHSANIRLSTVAMITSKVEGFKLEGDLLLKDWERAKLLHPSLVRLAKIATLDGDLIEKSLGRLSERDLRAVKTLFQKQFQYWL